MKAGCLNTNNICEMVNIQDDLMKLTDAKCIFMCLILQMRKLSCREIKLSRPVTWWWEVLALDNTTKYLFEMNPEKNKQESFYTCSASSAEKKFKILYRPSSIYLPVSSLLNADQ